MFSDAAVALPQIKAGKLRAYGTSAAKQNTLIPEVPPIARTVPGFDWQAWQGIAVPKATPPEVVARLSQEMQKFQQTPEFRQFLANVAMEPWPPITPAGFAALVQDDMGRWAEAVRVSGAKVE
jgi:tripartite-type tricarboxylate transporter receptor subunit TctC